MTLLYGGSDWGAKFVLPWDIPQEPSGMRNVRYSAIRRWQDLTQSTLFVKEAKWLEWFGTICSQDVGATRYVSSTKRV